MSILIYVEGGHQGSTKSACRQAFRMFLEKIVPAGSFQVKASGSRADAFQDFRTAIRTHAGDHVLLLVDSEGPVVTTPWAHLQARVGDHWHQPAGTTDDQVHLMVQIMESWFFADRATLIAYYGDGFLANSLPGQANVELIPKNDVLGSLGHASKPTQKGGYHKTRHAFDLLEKIDPIRVRTSSAHANRFFTVLTNLTNGLA